MQRKTFTAKILNKEILSADMVCFTVAKPKKYNYIAGQFTQFYIPDATSEKKEIVRPYSLASTPNDKDLKFYIKLAPNGKAGEYLKKIKTGEDLKIGEAMGKFINTDPINPLYFIATSVGVSPIIGIIQNELNNKKTTQPLYLLFGVRFENDIFLAETINNLKKQYKNFDYTLAISRPSEKWTGAKGRVTDYLPEKISAKGATPAFGTGPASGWEKNGQYFICGNMAMITDVRNFLEAQEIAKTNIHFEIM